jgi:hypothetical protein
MERKRWLLDLESCAAQSVGVTPSLYPLVEASTSSRLPA